MAIVVYNSSAWRVSLGIHAQIGPEGIEIRRGRAVIAVPAARAGGGVAIFVIIAIAKLFPLVVAPVSVVFPTLGVGLVSFLQVVAFALSIVVPPGARASIVSPVPSA